jgi:hypothetical protein
VLSYEAVVIGYNHDKKQKQKLGDGTEDIISLKKFLT